MGGKASKAVISGTPKKGDAAVEDVAIVQNGDTGKDGGNHIFMVSVFTIPIKFDVNEDWCWYCW